MGSQCETKAFTVVFFTHIPIFQSFSEHRWDIDVIQTLPIGRKRDVHATKKETGGGPGGFRKCDSSIGAACHVTGTAGFMMAGAAIEMLTSGNIVPPASFLLENRTNPVASNSEGGR